MRTRIRTQAIFGGIACTPDENALPLTQTCYNCIISDWTECNNRTRTRKRTQSINGVACTPEENALPETQTCENCIISDWSVCDDYNIRRRTRTQSINGGMACTLEENELPLSQSCNCVISNWSLCDNTSNMRTRIRTQAIFGGIACTLEQNELPLTQTCNNCIISDWTDCTACLYKTDSRVSMTDCTAYLKDCSVSQLTNCTNRIRTRRRTQSINGIACTPDENALPLTQKCDDENMLNYIINYIINLFNLIILYITNLFKKN
jgi:hypothetical protein